jgi:hypothetical protein
LDEVQEWLKREQQSGWLSYTLDVTLSQDVNAEFEVETVTAFDKNTGEYNGRIKRVDYDPSSGFRLVSEDLRIFKF